MSMFHQAAKSLHKDIYHEFKLALERGVWRSGKKLTEHQRKICEEVVSIHEANKYERPETIPILNCNLLENVYLGKSEVLH